MALVGGDAILLEEGLKLGRHERRRLLLVQVCHGGQALREFREDLRLQQPHRLMSESTEQDENIEEVRTNICERPRRTTTSNDCLMRLPELRQGHLAGCVGEEGVGDEGISAGVAVVRRRQHVLDLLLQQEPGIRHLGHHLQLPRG